MKQFIALLSCVFVLLNLCACSNSNAEIENLKQEIEALKQENESLRNDQNEDISSDSLSDNLIVAFVAWDNNGLPIIIREYLSMSNGNYFSRINYDQINLMPGETYNGKDGNTYSGMKISGDIQVSDLKAIVISYEDFDGDTTITTGQTHPTTLGAG